MKLYIIIPVFNEEKTILEILKRVDNIKIPGFTKEIILVDDGSSDNTVVKVKKSKLLEKIKFMEQKVNQGKGSAVKTGISKTTRDYIIIQNAEFEYKPKNIEKHTNKIKKKAQK